MRISILCHLKKVAGRIIRGVKRLENDEIIPVVTVECVAQAVFDSEEMLSEIRRLVEGLVG